MAIALSCVVFSTQRGLNRGHYIKKTPHSKHVFIEIEQRFLQRASSRAQNRAHGNDP